MLVFTHNLVGKTFAALNNKYCIDGDSFISRIFVTENEKNERCKLLSVFTFLNTANIIETKFPNQFLFLFYFSKKWIDYCIENNIKFVILKQSNTNNIDNVNIQRIKAKENIILLIDNYCSEKSNKKYLFELKENHFLLDEFDDIINFSHQLYYT